MKSQTSPNHSYSLANTVYFLLAIVLVGWLLVIGRDVLIPFVLALVVWYILDALAKKLVKLCKPIINIPYWLAMLGSFIVSGIAILMTVSLVADNAQALSNNLPKYEANLEKTLQGLVDKLPTKLRVDINTDRLDQSVTGAITSLINPQKLLGWASSIITNITAIISMIAIYLIFIFIESQYFHEKMQALFPDPQKRSHAAQVRDHIMKSIGDYLSVVTFGAVITGVACTVILLIIGVDYPVFWGFIFFLFSYIPNIGAILSIAFPALLALVQFDTMWQFFAVLILLTLSNAIAGNYIQPRMMGDSLNLSGLVILLSLALWGAMWGITGMLLSVPITVMIMIVFAQFPMTRPIAILLSQDGKIK